MTRVTFFLLISSLRKHLTSLLFNVRARAAESFGTNHDLLFPAYNEFPSNTWFQASASSKRLRPTTYDPMSWRCRQPVKSILAQSLQHSAFGESRERGEARACGKWARWEVALRPGKTFWCAMFFHETTHSQSTPLGFTHAGTCRSGQKCQIEHSEAKSADLCDVLVVICPRGTDERARRSHQSSGDRVHKELQLVRIPWQLSSNKSHIPLQNSLFWSDHTCKASLIRLKLTLCENQVIIELMKFCWLLANIKEQLGNTSPHGHQTRRAVKPLVYLGYSKTRLKNQKDQTLKKKYCWCQIQKTCF